jgi:hypothetical protein
MRRLWAPMEFAVFMVSEWLWLPLKDKLTGWDRRVEAAKRQERW